MGREKNGIQLGLIVSAPAQHGKDCPRRSRIFWAVMSRGVGVGVDGGQRRLWGKTVRVGGKGHTNKQEGMGWIMWSVLQYIFILIQNSIP